MWGEKGGCLNKGVAALRGPGRLSQIAVVADWLCGRAHDRVGSHPLSPAAPPSVPGFHTAKAATVIRSLQNHHHPHHHGRDLLPPPRFLLMATFLQ